MTYRKPVGMDAAEAEQEDFIYKAMDELETFEMEIEDGKLEGCVVYHESVRAFLVDLLWKHEDEIKTKRDREWGQFIETTILKHLPEEAAKSYKEALKLIKNL